MNARPRLLVDIVADPVCPWCYVGLNAFAKAKAELAAAYDVLPRFRAYQLNPDLPEEGVDRAAHYARKFPDPDFLAAMRERLKQAAREAGFEFDPAKPQWLPNTLKAHLVLHWAHFEGAQERAAFAIYRAFWEDGADIGDIDTLAALAGEAGMDGADVRKRLEKGESLEAVFREARAMQAAGVTGVPTFIVNERLGFSGALAPGPLAEALAQAASGA